MVFCRMRWKSIGSSAAGLAPYFSESLSMESCTMSRAFSASRTANSACLYARRSTLARNSDSSFREARKASFFAGRMTSARAVRWYQKPGSGAEWKLDQSDVSNYALKFSSNPVRDGRGHGIDGRRDCREVPPGGGSRVRLRLSRRRGPVHLRRVVQAGQSQAHPGAART